MKRKMDALARRAAATVLLGAPCRLGTSLRQFGASCLIWITGGCLLCRFEYLQNFAEIDNLAGMIPVALILTGAGALTVLIWMRHTRRFAFVLAVLMLIAAASAAGFPLALRGDWWLNRAAPPEAAAGIDLTAYAPFAENSKLVQLGAASALTFSEDLPMLDGATALYPVYAAFAEALYAPEAFSPDDVRCSNTRGAYEALTRGECDIIFVAGASETQNAAAEAAGADLRFTPLGREAFVFLVGKENPIDGISIRQIRNIYSGKTARWRTLGWAEGGKMIVFQRPEGSGSQTGLQQIMTGLPIQVPQPLPDPSLIGSGSLMRQVSVRWRGVQPAIGYSYRYYATAMYANADAKILRVDGVDPSVENIRSGNYPFVADFYAVTNGAPTGNARRLIDWALSPQGQEIIEATGYVSVR